MRPGEEQALPHPAHEIRLVLTLRIIVAVPLQFRGSIPSMPSKGWLSPRIDLRHHQRVAYSPYSVSYYVVRSEEDEACCEQEPLDASYWPS